MYYVSYSFIFKINVCVCVYMNLCNYSILVDLTIGSFRDTYNYIYIYICIVRSESSGTVQTIDKTNWSSLLRGYLLSNRPES